jgi:tyrosyl-tRNA synthetase
MTDLRRGIIDIFPDANLNEFLSKPKRVKLGFDPTSDFLHLGHSILLKKLQAFQKLGHTPVVIIGDFTARIGDPTGKSTTRIQISKEKVANNAKSFIDILGRFLDLTKCEIVFNSSHLESLQLSDIIKLQSFLTVQQLLAKQDFSDRINNETPISLHEFTYPLLQGFDSFAVSSDIELGGIDQKFNVSIGRTIQRGLHAGQQQIGMLMSILVGTDGIQKMSKSLNNAIGIDEHPLQMYSKLEKIPDSAVIDYITLLTDLDLKSFSNDPRERQKQMALEVTTVFHGKEVALQAQKDAEAIVLNGSSVNSTSDIPKVSLETIQFPIPFVNLLKSLNLLNSTSEGKRRIKGGSIRLNGTKVVDETMIVESLEMIYNKTLQLSKREIYVFKEGVQK